jgi:SAM-dependent methyltransferase
MTLKALYWDASRTIRDARLRRHRERDLLALRTIIAKAAAPQTERTQADFDNLQAEFRGPGEYGYGFLENWQRGLGRSEQLARQVEDLHQKGRVLEVACGDGMTSVVLSTLGVHVETTDLKDWRDPRAKHLPFTACDLGDEGAFPGGEFDLIFSYNAFEHFPDPRSALRRMVKAAKPGAWLFFEFGPLFSGPWGLHAYRMLRMPYPQFLFGESFWQEKVRAIGVRDLGQTLEDLQPLNRWKVSEFDALWRDSGCELVRSERYTELRYIDMVLRYPEAFQGRGLTEDDLTTQAVCVVLRKPA